MLVTKIYEQNRKKERKRKEKNYPVNNYLVRKIKNRS